MDLARLRRLRIAAAAITLLFTLGVFDQLKTPALPMPARAAASVEEIADRLRGHLDDDVTYAPHVTLPGIPLLAWCWPENIETRMPPEGVPTYSGKLLPPEMDEPLEVRFWITSPETAVSAVAAASSGTEECGRPDDDVLKDVADFNQRGWLGVQALVTTDVWTEDGDSGASATIVAARGGLLAEVTWAWPFEADGEPDPHVLLQGTVSATSVLAAVGGDPAKSALATTTRSASAAMAAALPPPSAYGKDMVSWPVPGSAPGSHELVCGDPFHEQNAYSGAPAVTRRLIGEVGEVSVREDVLFLPEEQSAERARTRSLGWDGSCLSDEGEQSYSIDPRLEPFTSGPWTGEIKTFAVQRPDPPRRPKGIYRRSVAHVAVGVRHGTAMVYLRWQGPVGTDPAAALRTGRAAITRTLDRLPVGD
ncbi:MULTISPECIES: hypothetical protein [Streptosporangium]|uniref:DUF3558 domain-containing protein n=1 Tax=Streptosporangium brasiliense TaxID=47480 RepID=A0ABT9RH78_9ACTN|nr:hypothetical protein [Streptosporangium brasiliense]MDP9868632.1 hypothetical protein [Streptosporangium brasiliense]